MKKITCLPFILFFALSLVAQEQKETVKVVVIEKETTDGEEIKNTKTVYEGEEAEKYLQEHQIELEGAEIEKEAEINVDIKTQCDNIKKEKKVEIDENGIETITYKVVIEDQNGKKKTMEWEGTDKDEVPEEIMEHFRNDPIKLKKQDGAEEEFEIKSGGSSSEVPEDVKKQMEDNNQEIKILNIGGYAGDESTTRNKAQLGVMIDNHENGIVVTGIIEDSSAAMGGLESGDIITHVDKQKVSTVKELIDKVKTFYADDVITVDFLRQTQKMSKSFILQKSLPRTWDEATKGIKK